MAFCEKMLEAFPVSDRASAICTKMDPPLAKAGVISNGGSSSVRTYLRKWKNFCQQTL